MIGDFVKTDCELNQEGRTRKKREPFVKTIEKAQLETVPMKNHFNLCIFSF